MSRNSLGFSDIYC